MKLLMITSLKEHLPQVTVLLRRANIAVYSVTRTTGMRSSDGANILDDWFGNQSGDFDSVFLFSYTDDGSAFTAVALVDEYNKAHKTGFPLRAFVLPVDKTSQSTNNE